ncbi:ATP-binding protein [Legionella sainthelensi]|uniref:PAS domain-containing sensor histidine kinase n=1 Tax=Legionella sainthelensi TaxID=28087 RepID=UPI000C79D735|nr:ATP-binding protein [Legionella sainthelensi]AYK03141.1 GHKL domain-containing protein [Legionella sainthelensi]
MNSGIQESSLQIQNEARKLREQLILNKKKLISKDQKINTLKLEIEKLKQQFSNFYDFNSAPFVLINKNYQIDNVNFQAATLLNYERNHLINTCFLNLMDVLPQKIFKECIQNLLEQGIKQNCELPLLQKGGEPKYLVIECNDIIDNLILLHIKEITYVRPLNSQQIQLNQSLETFSNLLQNISDPIAILDKEFCFKMANSTIFKFFSKVFTLKIEKGMNFLILISDLSEYKQLIEGCHQALAGQETSILIENLSGFYFEINFTPIYNISTKNTEIILLIKDLTNFYIKKKLKMKEQAKLAHAARLNTMEEMASALAHEINQPLTAIFLYAQACILESQKKENCGSFNLFPLLNKIINQAKHAGEIMNRMKCFIHNDVYFPQTIDINTLIKDAIKFLDYEINLPKLKINLQLENNLPLLNIDRIQIMQIILNLAKNSIEAMESNPSPEITIKTVNKLEYIEIHLRDNGPGINKEHKEKILHSYFTTKPQGSGLGLTICKNLVEAHKGKLLVQNSEKGAWFIFTLPKE